MSHPNLFHSGNWKITLSNIPGVRPADMKYIDNYYKGVTIPDYNMIEHFSNGPAGEMERHPSSRKNEDLSQLQIDFKLSEDAKNYLYFLQWMLARRYGIIDKSRDTRLWQNTINRITIEILDNQKRNIATIYCTEANLLNLSSLSLDFGSEEETIFTTNFSYKEIGFEFDSTNIC